LEPLPIFPVPIFIHSSIHTTSTARLHHQHAPGDLAGVARVDSGLITPDGTFDLYTVGRTLSYLYVVEGLK
jgi:hypothetical protein